MDFRKMLKLLQCCIGTFIVIGLTLQSTVAESKVYFPYNLVEAHHAIAGRVTPEAYHGQRVKAIVESEGHGDEEPDEHFLKINKEKNTESAQARTKTPLDITMSSGNLRPTPTAHRHTQPSGPPELTTEDDFTHDHHAVKAHFNVPTRPAGHARMGHVIMPDFAEGDEPRTDHTIHIVHKRNVAAPSPPRKQTTVVTTEIVVLETTAFTVDKEGYLVVNDTTEIEEQDIIEFFVLLEDISTRRALSNPLPFMIYVDRPVSDKYPAVPAVFAGVLVLIVVFFAFMIPFVIRAKRRVKQGKPVFKLGSHASGSDLTRVDTFSDMTSRDSEANFLGGPNAYYNYAAEVQHEKSHFGHDLKEYTRSHPPTLQLSKKTKYPSDESSSSGVDLSSQGGAEGTIADETSSERL